MLYFRHENGSYKRVPQYPNAQLGTDGRDAPDIKGGMTVYYTQKDFTSNGNQHITAFKPVSGACVLGRALAGFLSLRGRED